MWLLLGRLRRLLDLSKILHLDRRLLRLLRWRRRRLIDNLLRGLGRRWRGRRGLLLLLLLLIFDRLLLHHDMVLGLGHLVLRVDLNGLGDLS